MSIAYSLQPIINRDSRHDIGDVELRMIRKARLIMTSRTQQFKALAPFLLVHHFFLSCV